MTTATRTKPDSTWKLYRWWDDAGVLLYIGITTSTARREVEHREKSWWSRWATRFEVDAGFSQAAAHQASALEVALIRAERPIFNVNPAIRARDRMTLYIVSRGEDAADFARYLPAQETSRRRLSADLGQTRQAQPGAEWVTTRIEELERELAALRRLRDAPDLHRDLDTPPEGIDL